MRPPSSCGSVRRCRGERRPRAGAWSWCRVGASSSRRAQLAAIAHQFDVDWRPVSTADRAVLESAWASAEARGRRGGGPRTRWSRRGRRPIATSRLPEFTARWFRSSPIRGRSCRDLDYDHERGRFTAVLSVTGDGMEPIDCGSRRGRRRRSTCRSPPPAFRRRHAARRRCADGAGPHVAWCMPRWCAIRRR